MQITSQDPYILLKPNTPEKTVKCLINRLNPMNIQEVFHTERLKHMNDISEKYNECMIWLEEEYAKRPLAKSIGAKIDPTIQNEHNYAIQLVMKKQMANEHLLKIVHESIDPFDSTRGDLCERLGPIHLEMIFKLLTETPVPISLTLDNLSMTDKELQTLIPAIAMRKVNSLSVRNNALSDSALKSLTEAIHKSQPTLHSLFLDGNAVSDKEVLAFQQMLQKDNPLFTFSCGKITS